MKKYIFPVIAVMLVLFLIDFLQLVPEPEHCAICDSIPYHAPCLVNLATGEVGELEVYDPHPFKTAELNSFQRGGTFSFLYVAGLNGYRDTVKWEAHITIPTNDNEYEEKFFCKSCRDRIRDYTDIGYLLLDLQIPKSFSILLLNSDIIQDIRCYQIITKTMLDETEITVHGNWDIMN